MNMVNELSKNFLFVDVFSVFNFFSRSHICENVLATCITNIDRSGCSVVDSMLDY